MNRMKKITFIAYDTFCTISIFGKEDREAGLLLEQAKELALSVQSTLNMYDACSELSRLCGTYTPGIPEKISPMLYDFIQLNLQFSRQTEGAFDFTVGPLMRLWDFLSDHPKVPGEEMLEEALKKVGYQHVHLDQKEQSVMFDVADMTLDPGASGKGYALAAVVDFLEGHGVRHGVLDFGGNLFVMGNKACSDEKPEPWRVGIRHPETESCLGGVELADRGMATSSWYEHSFRKGVTVYHHLLNPYTGKPQEMDISSVSILSSKAVYTDLLSTAFFIMGYEAGCKLAEDLKASQGVDADYILLTKDGDLLTSERAWFIGKA